MKTLNKLYLSLILLLTSLSATDKSYSFLGIQTATSVIESKIVPTLGLKYGQQTKKHRTSLSYNYGNKSNTSYQTLIVQIDTGILKKSFEDYAFKPYAGVSFGLMQENNKHTSQKDRGYVYGVNTGLAYIFNDALDFNLGYRYMETSKLKNIDSISDLTLSMHYFY